MNRTALALTLVILCVYRPFLHAEDASPAGERAGVNSADRFDRSIAPILNAYCNDCHNDDEPQGNLALGNMNGRVSGRDFETWRMIYERVYFDEMPPDDAKQPSDLARKKLLAWIRGELLKTQQPGAATDSKLMLPQYGNYVDHRALFDTASDDVVIPAPPRLWRLRPQIYESLSIGNASPKDSHDLSQPLSLARGAEFKDYAARYFIDEPATGMLLSNAEQIVRFKSRAVLDQLTEKHSYPKSETIASAIHKTFAQIMHREPTMAEVSRFAEFHRRVFDNFGHQLAAEKLLTAIYLQPEALFREELGEGRPDKHGRVRLSQLETALAISFALDDRPDELLLAAASRSELHSREQIAVHLKRRFDSPPTANGNPRILEFFREFFNYPYARDVFKNRPKLGSHRPGLLTTDLDLLISHIVRQDENVLFKLLTTHEYFVDCRKDPRTGELSQASLNQTSSDVLLMTSDSEYVSVYGMPRDWIWTDQQPVAVPPHMRAGVLTHPAWLAAWSGNFDNHPVQRGKWIRTHLLGGTVPDVPIGVEAIVPEDHHKQFRQRLAMATANAECWRCHKKMDPLGLPFEQFDHYGRFRIRELGRPVDTSGSISFTDDEFLAGDVEDPFQMIHRLAKSVHVEQVFVRHVFRYIMGRNETLGDAKTLQEAHQAYRNRRGSFRALVVSLLTSDSFLLRHLGEDDPRRRTGPS